MKKQQAKAASAILCLVVLVGVQGCTTPQKRVSGKSWNQTAAREDHEQQLRASPQGEWNVLP
jgi:hypothetical protein